MSSTSSRRSGGTSRLGQSAVTLRVAIIGGYGNFGGYVARALASGQPAILHCGTDPEALTIDRSLSEIRAASAD